MATERILHAFLVAAVLAAAAAFLLLGRDAFTAVGQPLGAVGLADADGAALRTIDIDASTVTGRIRSLQGLNAGPRPPFPGMADLTGQYSAIGVDYVRTHDYFGPCDMNEIFPDWNADPTLESSYDFASTDQELAAIRAAGADILFRLGYSYGDPAAQLTSRLAQVWWGSGFRGFGQAPRVETLPTGRQAAAS